MSNSATARRRHERDVRRRKQRQIQARRALEQAAMTNMLKTAAHQFAGKPTILRDAKGIFHIRAGGEHYRTVHP